MKYLSTCLALSLMVSTGCGAPEALPDDAPEVASKQSAVQATYLSGHVDYDTTTGSRISSTGAIYVPMRNNDGSLKKKDGWRVRGTCGVTFVTPHYAITAAHCVSSKNLPDPATDKVTVRQFKINGISAADLGEARKLTWHPYPDWSSKRTLNSSHKYRVWTYSCKVVSRCHSTWGKHGFCKADGADFNADIALIHCADRPDTASYLRVAASDPAVGNVYMNWFHEVYNIPTQISYPTLVHLADLYNHYTTYPTDRGENFHYLGTKKIGPFFPKGPGKPLWMIQRKNQLLPLRSRNWLTGQPRTRVGSNGTVVWTDLFGCHGTSGSGVLRWNSLLYRYELLGPVALGGSAFSGRLCMDTTAASPGGSHIAYTQLQYTSALANFAAFLEAFSGLTIPVQRFEKVSKQQIKPPIRPIQLF